MQFTRDLSVLRYIKMTQVLQSRKVWQVVKDLGQSLKLYDVRFLDLTQK